MSLKENNNQIIAILLAAGGSRRLGKPKQLLFIKNELLINFIIGQIRNAGLYKIKVVLGSHFSEINEKIAFNDVEILENRDWEGGISSSIRCGLNGIGNETAAVAFFVVDQPYLNSRLIRKTLDKFYKSDANIIAASVTGRLIHPVIFRRVLFPKLLNLRGEEGGKTLFKEEIIEIVNFRNKKLLFDIDTEEDYKLFNKRVI